MQQSGPAHGTGLIEAASAATPARESARENISITLHDWLSVEIATVEASLQGQGPTCQLDREHAAPSSLKQSEGRYAILRRARRLLERGRPLSDLDGEARKARAALASDQGLARDPAWRAYFTGVLEALDDLARASGTSDRGP